MHPVLQQTLWGAATDEEITRVENLTLQKGPKPPFIKLCTELCNEAEARRAARWIGSCIISAFPGMAGLIRQLLRLWIKPDDNQCMILNSASFPWIFLSYSFDCGDVERKMGCWSGVRAQNVMILCSNFYTSPTPVSVSMRIFSFSFKPS